MNLFRGARLVVVGVLLLVASTGSAVYLLGRGAGDTPPATPASPGAPRGVVCFGFVDVEPGVASLYPVQPGRVAKVLVKETDPVKKGKVLLRLEDQTAQARVAEAKAALRAAEAAFALAQQAPGQHQFKIKLQQDKLKATGHRLEAARALLKRAKQLNEAGQGGDTEVTAATEQVKELEVLYDSEQATLKELERQDPQAEVRRAEAEVELAKAREAQAEALLAECELKAPDDGEVLRLLVTEGDVLSAQPRQPAVLFCRSLPRLVRAEVEQEFAAAVRQDMPAVIEDDTQPGVRWTGRVLRLSDWYTPRRSTSLDPMQFNDVRTIECLVSLEGGPAPRIGQRVRVRIGAP